MSNYEDPIYKVEFLLKRREHIGVSQEGMAEALGYRRSMRGMASRWERGFEKPPPHRREQMLEYLADTLRLRNEPELFLSFWAQIAQEWGWAVLSAEEQKSYCTAKPSIPTEDNPLFSEKFTHQIKELCRLLGAGTLIQSFSGAPVYMFVMQEQRSFRRIDRTLVACLDNAVTEVTEGVLSIVNQYIEQSFQSGLINNAIIVTKLPVSGIYQQFIQHSAIFQTEDELLRGLINFDRYIQQIITKFEQGDEERFGKMPLAKCFTEVNAWILPQLPTYDLKPVTTSATKAITNWLERERDPILVVFGEYGTGKSTLCLKIAYELAKAYQQAEDKSNLRIPIVIPLRIFPKSSVIDFATFFASYLKSHCQVDNPDPEAFRIMNDAGLFLLIFDGFDEMAVRMDSDILERNFLELLQLVTSPANKVMLTSRTEVFFNQREEDAILVGVENLSFMKEEGLSKIWLQLFTDVQIREYIQKLHPNSWEDDYAQIEKVIGLENTASRPILLEITLSVLPEVKQVSGIISRPLLYTLYIDKELTRQRVYKKRDLLTHKEQRIKMLCALAGYLYTSGEISTSITQIQETLIQIFTDHQRGDVEAYVRDFIACSFMVRSGDKYYFSHRSFQEYLAARVISDEIDQNTRNLLRNSRLTSAVAEWLSDFFRFENKAKWVAQLWFWVEQSKQQSSDEVQFLGGNAISLLPLFGESLSKRDLSQAKLRGAELAGVNCSATNFDQCDLSKANLSRSDCRKATFRSARMHRVNLEEANLTDAQFVGADLTSGKLTGAQILDTNFQKCDFDEATFYSAKVGERVFSDSPLQKHVRTHSQFKAAHNTSTVHFFKPRGCFVAGTQVMLASRELKSIEQIIVGEELLSFCFESNTLVPSRVSCLFRGDTDTLIIINSTIYTTPLELIGTEQGWVRAHNLQVGDLLTTINGSQPITSIEVKHELTPIYNLTTIPNHNYFVEYTLVHNMPKMGTGFNI